MVDVGAPHSARARSRIQSDVIHCVAGKAECKSKADDFSDHCSACCCLDSSFFWKFLPTTPLMSTREEREEKKALMHLDRATLIRPITSLALILDLNQGSNLLLDKRRGIRPKVRFSLFSGQVGCVCVKDGRSFFPSFFSFSVEIPPARQDETDFESHLCGRTVSRTVK